MRTFRRMAMLATVIAMAGLAQPAAATGLHDRIYFLSDGTGALYWSVDAADPEAALSSSTRTCSSYITGRGDRRPCSPVGVSANSGNQVAFHTMRFSQKTVLHDPASWTASAPLRFRIAARIITPVPASLHLVVEKTGGVTFESAAAQEVSAGVYEGTLKTGSPIPASGAVTSIGIRIRTPSPAVDVELGLRGSSWIDLPAPVRASSTRDSLAADTYEPAPSALKAGSRSFEFNDGDWELASFSGDLTQTRTFGTATSRTAAIVLAWVEAFDEPVVYNAVRRQDVDTERVTDTPLARLLWNGKELQHTSNGAGQRGRGYDAVAALDVPAGAIDLEVSAQLSSTGASYQAHILKIYGERTLASMRWRFMFPYLEPAIPHRTPVTSACSGAPDPIPSTPALATFTIDVDWESVNPAPSRWVPRYGSTLGALSSCGDEHTSDKVRVTIPGKQMFYVTAGPAHDTSFVSVRDTRYEFGVVFTYSPVS